MSNCYSYQFTLIGERENSILVVDYVYWGRKLQTSIAVVFLLDVKLVELYIASLEATGDIGVGKLKQVIQVFTAKDLTPWLPEFKKTR